MCFYLETEDRSVIVVGNNCLVSIHASGRQVAVDMHGRRVVAVMTSDPSGAARYMARLKRALSRGEKYVSIPQWHWDGIEEQGRAASDGG
jgi:hypothetical protein